MTNHTTSLPLSKRLDKAGVKQTSEYAWFEFKNGQSVCLHKDDPTYDQHERNSKYDESYTTMYSAFLASELLEGLPRKIDDDECGECHLAIHTWIQGTWMVSYQAVDIEPLIDFTAKYIPIALGEMKLWVIENGYE